MEVDGAEEVLPACDLSAQAALPAEAHPAALLHAEAGSVQPDGKRQRTATPLPAAAIGLSADAMLLSRAELLSQAVQRASAARNAVVAAQGAVVAAQGSLVAAQRAEKSAIAEEEKPMKKLWAQSLSCSSVVPVGLMNVGNTCYIAAVLQALCASFDVDAYAGVEVLCTEPSCDKCRLASLVLTALRNMSSGCLEANTFVVVTAFVVRYRTRASTAQLASSVEQSISPEFIHT